MLIAMLLLGYTAYDYARQAREAREDAAHYQQLAEEARQAEVAFYQALLSEPFRQRIERLQEAKDAETRERIAIEVEIALKPMQARFPDGYYVLSEVRRIAELEDPEVRAAAGDAFLDEVNSIAVHVLDLDAADILVPPPTFFTAISGLVTGIGGVGAGLVA